MDKLITITLNSLRFRGYHGLFSEEKKIGNEFTVQLTVTYHPPKEIITDLNDTLDYGKLYQLVSDEIKKPRALLETFVMEVASLIHQRHPNIYSVEMAITKLAVPIVGFEGAATVTYKKIFT